MPGNTENLPRRPRPAPPLRPPAPRTPRAMIREGEQVTFRGLAARQGYRWTSSTATPGSALPIIERHRTARPARPEPAARRRGTASSVVRTLTAQLADLKRRHREETAAEPRTRAGPRREPPAAPPPHRRRPGRTLPWQRERQRHRPAGHDPLVRCQDPVDTRQGCSYPPGTGRTRRDPRPAPRTRPPRAPAHQRRTNGGRHLAADRRPPRIQGPPGRSAAPPVPHAALTPLSQTRTRTGKTVAIRSAVADLDPSGHTVIYIGNPATGVRGILAHVVTALGGRPVDGTAALAIQAWSVLAGEAAERGRTRS